MASIEATIPKHRGQDLSPKWPFQYSRGPCFTASKRHRGALKRRLKDQLMASLLQVGISPNIWETKAAPLILAKSDSFRLFYIRGEEKGWRWSKEKRQCWTAQFQSKPSPALTCDQWPELASCTMSGSSIVAPPNDPISDNGWCRRPMVRYLLNVGWENGRNFVNLSHW